MIYSPSLETLSSVFIYLLFPIMITYVIKQAYEKLIQTMITFVRDRLGGSAFVIQDSDLDILVAGGCYFFEPTVLLAELWGAWVGIVYAQRILHLDRIIIEGDSAIVISWIREAMRLIPLYSLIRDIALLLKGCSAIILRHVFREANSMAD